MACRQSKALDRFAVCLSGRFSLPDRLQSDFHLSNITIVVHKLVTETQNFLTSSNAFLFSKFYRYHLNNHVNKLPSLSSHSATQWLLKTPTRLKRLARLPYKYLYLKSHSNISQDCMQCVATHLMCSGIFISNHLIAKLLMRCVSDRTFTARSGSPRVIGMREQCSVRHCGAECGVV